jgi:hypothetical protein
MEMLIARRLYDEKYGSWVVFINDNEEFFIKIDENFDPEKMNK